MKNVSGKYQIMSDDLLEVCKFVDANIIANSMSDYLCCLGEGAPFFFLG